MINVKPCAGVAAATRRETNRPERGRLNTFLFLRRRLKSSGIGQPALCRPRATGHHQPDQCQRRTR